MNVEEDMKAISDAINEENGLCCEIIWSAMLYLQQNPDASIPDAIDYGFGEWVK